MSIRLKTLFLLILSIFILWFLFIERTILTPFIVAAIFAYIVNPFVNLLNCKLNIPRTLAVIIIYLLLSASIIAIGIITSQRIVSESDDLRSYINHVILQTNKEVSTFPTWARQIYTNALVDIGKSQYITTTSLIGLFPSAFSRIISFLIFLFSSFYFLKDGRTISEKLLNQLPNKYKIEVGILFRRINAVLGSYLRGQLLMILFMTIAIFIALSIIGERFALVVAVFSGFAEVVPL